MKILSIETSCDETAVSIVEATGPLEKPIFSVLGNALYSQIKTHAQYGGVFPMMAKREHAQNFPHLLQEALTEAGLYIDGTPECTDTQWAEAEKILVREDALYHELRKVIEHIKRPNIDLIAVTSGPGLEPALWVGISAAVALGTLWRVPVLPTNHMEGHIVSVLMENSDNRPVEFPALALLVSGGHTELVSVTDWGTYKTIGQTRDDAVGEAFDKVARMLNLPYPGGPEISKLAEEAVAKNLPKIANLPRPMIHTDNLDFSFSGLKTAVLYYLRDNPNVINDHEQICDLAREFQNAVIDVLITKTKRAIEQTGAHTLIIGGGVISNTALRTACKQLEHEYTDLIVRVPTHALSTDNALMIACAGYMRVTQNPELLKTNQTIIARGNMTL
jgi:N6-L-threonylcarbamoyladenine synthase